LYCSRPVAVYIPAVNNRAPAGIKKQKNKPVLPYTNKNTISNPPSLISESGSKIFKKPSKKPMAQNGSMQNYFTPIMVGEWFNSSKIIPIKLKYKFVLTYA